MLVSLSNRRSAQRALTTVALVVLLGAPSASAWPPVGSARAQASASNDVPVQQVGDRGWGGAPPSWPVGRPGASIYDKRRAADWGAAAAAGAIGLDAIDTWALQNVGPPPGSMYPGPAAPVSARPDPNEIGPRQPRPEPGPDAIGPPSPTQIQESGGCYTTGPDLICPND